MLTKFHWITKNKFLISSPQSSSTNPEILVIDWNDLGSSSSTSSCINTTNNSEFEIEFVDRENELKYDRLVTQNKIKSPFKRKHSNERLGESVAEEGRENVNETNMKKFKESEPTTTARSESECSSPVPSSTASEVELETNADVLDRRQKQIDYGKNTQGYLNFSMAHPNK